MNEYPPELPNGDFVVPLPISPDQLAVTGFDFYWISLAAVILVFLGIWMLLHVGKKSDKHHKDN